MRVKDLELCTLFAFPFVEWLIFSHNFTSSIICLSKDERLYSLPPRRFTFFFPLRLSPPLAFLWPRPLAWPCQQLSALVSSEQLSITGGTHDVWWLPQRPSPLPATPQPLPHTPYPYPNLHHPPLLLPIPPPTHLHRDGKRRHMKGKVEEGKGKRRGSKCCALLSKESEWWSRGKF